MQLASETLEIVLQKLRELRTELNATGNVEHSTKLSRLATEYEKYVAEALEREREFAPFDKYSERFIADNIAPFQAACPVAASVAETLAKVWLAERGPTDNGDYAIQDELDDAIETLKDAVDDGDAKLTHNVAKIIMPLARRLESKRLKAGHLVAFSDSIAAERDLGEQIIKAAYPLVTGRQIKLRADTGRNSVGGFVKVDKNYADSPEWFAICDAIGGRDSNVLRTIFNSSLSKPSRWAAARVRLYVDGELVPYTTAEFPWCLEILDERQAIRIFILKSTQVGVSTALFLRVLWELEYRGKNAIYYMPDESATRKLNLRLSNLIEASPYLASRIDATAEAKQIGQATLHLEGARGVSAGRSTPAEVIVLDEFDLFAPENAEEIAKRLTGAKNGLEICASTPSVPGVGIDGLVDRFAEQREHFVAPCPHCRASVALDFDTSFSRSGEFENDKRCIDSYIKCPSCSAKLDAETKSAMLANGHWELVDNSQERRTDTRVLADLNHLYSATVTPESIARASLKTGEAAVKEFYNSNLGRPYVEAKGQITPDILVRSVSPSYSMGQPNLPRVIDAAKPPRFLLIDQGRPHSAVVCETVTTARERWHSTFTDGYRCRVLWVEKVSERQRLDEIARMWQTWGVCLDVDPDDSLPSYLMFGRQRFSNSHGFVVGARALDSWTTFEGISLPEGIEDGDKLLPLSYVTFHRSHYYARAIDRVNAGNLVLPIDTPSQFGEELQAAVKTTRNDPTGHPRLWVAKKSNKPNDYLTCLQLFEVCLELYLTRKVGLR